MSIYLEGENDTICAVATPPGHGGIAVIRISGNEAVSIAKKICSFLEIDSLLIEQIIPSGIDIMCPLLSNIDIFCLKSSYIMF